MSSHSPEFKEDLKKISHYWINFYNKLEKWIEQDNLMPETKFSEGYVKEEWVEHIGKHNVARNTVIKKYVSSTHTWVKGKDRYSKKNANWHCSPFECKVCRMGASGHDEVGWAGEMAEATDMPTRDMHGQPIHRTCLEVQAAREEARKKHAGGKCIQCSTYGCLLEDY
jgi:hypothetical protein